MSASQPTFLWYDYETWGTHPGKDRPAQFAAIRTDMNFNVIGKHIELFCHLSSDYLPNPDAVFITHLTPQSVHQKGLPEAEFIRQINEAMSEPNTCVVGYNSLRFDDEVTRYTLYRNFFDPYAREWQNNCSRWDLIDLVRSCYALRPEGIEWPRNEEGTPTFRLEELTKANGIEHQKAHDAVSDVLALIDMAKLIHQAQPKLYDYYFNLRRKQKVQDLIDIQQHTPLVHVSGMFGHARSCTSIIAPVSYHPINKNAVIAIDLAKNIQPLIELTSEQIAERLYTSKENLGDLEPIPVKQIHTNKCPMVATQKIMNPEMADRLNIDLSTIQKQHQLLCEHPEIIDKLHQVFSQRSEFKTEENTDLMLYQGFFNHHDKALMQKIRETAPEHLPSLELNFDDDRLEKMFFLYRARNYPHTLDENERQQWQHHCQNALDVDGYLLQLENLVHEHEQDPEKLHLLHQLFQYLQQL